LSLYVPVKLLRALDIETFFFEPIITFQFGVFIEDQADHIVLYVPVKFQKQRGTAVRIPVFRNGQLLHSIS